MKRFINAVALTAAVMFGVVAQGADVQTIFKQADFHGGLIVYYGKGAGSLLEKLSDSGHNLVHHIVATDGEVQATRDFARSNGYAGIITASKFQGSYLPFTTNLVNLFIADKLDGLPMAEVVRVLSPNGVVCVGGKYIKKPRPADIDDWTHYLNKADNNAVARDKKIAPPKHLQWTGGPLWARHHDSVASMNAMVTTNGKLFYIMDEGTTASPLFPAKWRIIARDAFNGLVLWKRDMKDWIPSLWPLKAGPASLPRRLVAVDNAVYAPLGFSAVVSAIDARTGETLHSFKGTQNVEEIVVEGDLIYTVITTKPLTTVPDAGMMKEAEEDKFGDNERRTTKTPMVKYFWKMAQSGKYWFGTKRVIKVFNRHTGEHLWDKETMIMPLSLGVVDGKAYYHNGTSVVALDGKTGGELFTTAAVPVAKENLHSYFAPTLVVKDGVIVFAGGENIGRAWMGWERKDQGQDTMTAFSAEDGKTLWSAPHPYGGYNSPEDVLIAKGLVWCADTAKGGAEGAWIGRDLHTGEVMMEIPPTIKAKWFHHRCYRAKATEDYILPSRNGIECIDMNNKTWQQNNWVRSGCLYGFLPANGLIYSAPHNCACHPQTLLNGFNALAAESDSLPTEDSAPRLTKGRAYGAVKPQAAASGDWPIYRANPKRSGYTSQKVDAELTVQWQAELNGKLTQPVIFGDHLVVAEVESHTVYCLNARTGKRLWSYAAGGRIDSSPSFYNGYLIFGSADGYVTCLRAEDGIVAWSFRAAPADRRVIAFNQLESAWPVNGSVLVEDGTAWFTAGRSYFLDGGVRFYKLDIATGKVLQEKVFDNKDYLKDQDLHARASMLDMPVGKPDILGSDGKTLFMRAQLMDKNGNRTQDLNTHLFAPYGFVDGSWFHRSYWVFGKNYYGGCGGYSKAGKQFPSGRMMVHDDENVYVFGRESKYFRWITEMEYRLFSSPIAQAPAKEEKTVDRKGKKRKKMRSFQVTWEEKTPVLVRAMVKADDTLFIAGVPDLVDESQAVYAMHEQQSREKMAQQEAAYLGEHGGILKAVSCRDGKEQATVTLPYLPSFDGMSAANGALYITAEDGQLICLKGE